MTNCFVHMIEFEQTIEFSALLGSPTHIYIVAHMIGAGKRIILGHFRHTPDTIDRQPLPDFNVLIHVLNSTKIVAVAPWRSKTVVVEKRRAPIFDFLLVRNSEDGSWIFI